MGETISLEQRRQKSGQMNEKEQAIREDLAAVHRLAHRFGWDDNIYNHFSCALPGGEEFLVKAHGLLMSEVTASNLIVVDQQGQTVRGEGTVEQSALHIHAAIHLGRPDASCILHVHPPYTTWLSSMDDNRLKMTNQNTIRFFDRIVYDEAYEGLAVAREEGERMCQALGEKRIMIHVNHGVTVAGPTVEEAFFGLYYLELVCKEYFLVISSGGKARVIPDEICLRTVSQMEEEYLEGAQLTLAAWKRVLDREEEDFRN